MIIRSIFVLIFAFLLINVAWAEEPSGLEVPLDSVDGKKVRLADFKGKVVLVNFWATWCPPCLNEIPDLIKLQTQYAEQGLMVVGVNFMEQPDKKRLEQFIDEQGINYPIVFSDSKTLQGLSRNLGGVFALPVTKLLNREGKMVASHIGELNYAEMQAMVESLL